MDPKQYFLSSDNTLKRRYDALRAFYMDGLTAQQAAQKFGYTLSSFYSLTRDFRAFIKNHPKQDMFFKEVEMGRKPVSTPTMDDMIADLRKQNFSAEDIVGIVNSQGFTVSYGYVYSFLSRAGFARLPRRSKEVKSNLDLPKIKAPIAETLVFSQERFHSTATGLFAFLPIIRRYKIDTLIEESLYPQTKMISRLSSILSFIALKLSNVKRYSDDDLWCMDRGLGLFAGLNVLPKSAWLSSYSSRVTKDMNLQFLKSMHHIWVSHGLLSDTCNLDFTTIPYWGDTDHLENNWSGKRNKALASMLTVLAQDPDSGIIDYGSCDVQHKSQSRVVLEYLDFYYHKDTSTHKLNYLVFDSKFTNYENLSNLDDQQIKFITIRRRGKKVVQDLDERKKEFKTIRVDSGGSKKRTLRVLDETIILRGYHDKKTNEAKPIRQIAITGHGKTKPALIITNDFDRTTQELVRKYARRWLVEKGISEQIEFFHLNRISSSMVIKVDFDMVMTILAHNLYRLFARQLDRYSSSTAERIFEKFITNNGSIEITDDQIQIELKKKRDLPQLLEIIKENEEFKYPWLDNKKLVFYPSATS